MSHWSLYMYLNNNNDVIQPMTSLNISEIKKRYHKNRNAILLWKAFLMSEFFEITYFSGHMHINLSQSINLRLIHRTNPKIYCGHVLLYEKSKSHKDILFSFVKSIVYTWLFTESYLWTWHYWGACYAIFKKGSPHSNALWVTTMTTIYLYWIVSFCSKTGHTNIWWIRRTGRWHWRKLDTAWASPRCQ